MKYFMQVLLFISISILCSEGFCQDRIVAVHLFQNLTDSPEKDWIGVGLSDSIILNMRRIQGLQVVELEQLNKLMDVMKMNFSGLADETTTAKIGKMLGVQYLVMGNFQEQGYDIVVNYRMVEVETGKILFSDLVKGKLSGVIEVEEKVGKNIKKNMKIQWPELKIAAEVYEKPSSETLNTNYTKALACLLKSNAKEGLECYENVISEDPDNGDAYLGQGKIYLKDNNIAQALIKFNKALSIYKEKKDQFFICRAEYDIGEAYYARGDYVRSAGCYKNALEVRVENDFNVPLIYFRLSEIAHKNGQLKEAIKYAEKAVKENGKLVNKYAQVGLLINLANLYKEKQLYASAKETFNNVLAVSKEIGYPDPEELAKLNLELQNKQ